MHLLPSLTGAWMIVAAATLLVPTASAKIIFVNESAQGANNGTSWADAYVELRDALPTAIAGDELWVAAGTYRPAETAGDQSKSFEITEDIILYGGFAGWETQRKQRDLEANETILSGDLNGDDGPDYENMEDNSHWIITMAASPTLDGFTITAANDGAVFIAYASPLIRHCQFTRNVGSAAAAVENHAGNPTFEDCDFIANRALTYQAGAIYSDTSDNTEAGPAFVDCRFIGNYAATEGGAAYIVCGGGWCPEFHNCAWIGNIAGADGGAIWHEWNYSIGSTFVNNLFSGNSAGGFGGAMFVHDSVPNMYQCTISANTAESVGGLYSFDDKFGAGIHVYNSILWGNSDAGGMDESAQFDDSYQDEIDFSFSSVQGWTGKAGGLRNDGDDPLFVDADGIDDLIGTEDDDARLSSSSPSIDSGENASVPADQFDLDDDRDLAEVISLDLDRLIRFIDDPATEDRGTGEAPIVDRGAYEFQALPNHCIGDVNLDWLVDPLDSGYVMSRFNCTVGMGNALCDVADVNRDGIVDPLDVGLIFSRFGQCF